MNIYIKELKELLALLDEDGVDGFMYVVFRGKDSASIREFGNIYPQNVQIHLRTQNQDGAKVVLELEKQGEPVAWWTGKYEDEGEDFMFPNTRQAHIDHPQSETHKFFSIPLYTTPQTKPLSDEEIEEIAKQHLAAYAQFIGAGEVCYEGEIDFARAIEEAHGIK